MGDYANLAILLLFYICYYHITIPVQSHFIRFLFRVHSFPGLSLYTRLLHHRRYCVIVALVLLLLCNSSIVYSVCMCWSPSSFNLPLCKPSITENSFVFRQLFTGEFHSTLLWFYSFLIFHFYHCIVYFNSLHIYTVHYILFTAYYTRYSVRRAQYIDCIIHSGPV